MLIKVCQSCVRVMLKYVKAFTRDELNLVLVNLNTLVTLLSFLNIHVRMNERKEIKFKTSCLFNLV